MGNEIYRDEYGSVFVVPDIGDLLDKETEQGQEFKALLRKAFDAEEIWGELVPEIKVSSAYEGKDIKLAEVLETRRRKNSSSAEIASRWWSPEQSPETAEICTVCGQRPVGYPRAGSEEKAGLRLASWAKQDKAEERNVCRVCLHRRGRRARDWARNKKANGERFGPFERTIWTDEVADGNGCFALLVGRFVLDGWLDGKLIPTMLKSPSFARIRRCWDTTRQFWLKVRNDIGEKVGQRTRLGIRPAQLRGDIGLWHSCEAEIGGRRLGLCWDPNDHDAQDRDLFWTTDNLEYLAGLMGVSLDELKEHIGGSKVPLYEPGGYLGQDRPVSVAEGCEIVREAKFRPFIPLLVEPAQFMALIPGNTALNVVKAIKEKYEKEMGQVRDRLPIHLGLVFAPRRTVLRAVLDAGRAMLEMPASWEPWEIQVDDRKARFINRNGQKFVWEYRATMGDCITSDIWYPHLLTVDPGQHLELDRDVGHFKRVDEISSGSTVYIRPSRFDFEFLDTTARRFEIHYGENTARRRVRPTRPFLLDDLKRFEDLWEALCKLKRAQRHQIISTIEAAREDWFGVDPERKSWTDPLLARFVHDTLAGAEWPKTHGWLGIALEIREQLKNAGVKGELADLAELHMQILKEK